jgi:hypothetical protein
MNEEIIKLNQCDDEVVVRVQGGCDNININTGGTSVLSVNGRYGAVTLTKDDVGLSNVDNVSVYANFIPLSSAGNIFSEYLPLSGGTLTGKLSTTSTIDIKDVTFTGETLQYDTIEQITPLDQFLKIIVNGSVKYLKLYDVDILDYWVDEFGTQIVAENGTYLMV